MTGPELVAIGAPDGRQRWEFEHGSRRFLVLNHGGEYVVFDALCPHKQGRLATGLVRDGALVCPSHWYAFDLADGRCRTTPQYRLGRYRVVRRDGTLYAEIPPAPKRSWSEILRGHAADTSD